MEAAAGVEGLEAARLARPGMTTGGGDEMIGVVLWFEECADASGPEV